jgi:DNA-binding NarL/FixJ family response regulator
MQVTDQNQVSLSYSANHITPREIQILALMSQGIMNKDIAKRLNISTETVKQHVKNIYQKTGSHNKIEALNKTKWLTASLLSNQY